MADPTIFRVPVDDEGVLAFAIVDRDAVGYDDTWQAPAGKRFPEVALSDYASDSGGWSAQVTGAAFTSTPNQTTTERKATFRSRAAQTVVVGEDSFAIDGGYFQDPNDKAGLSRFLFKNRTKEAYAYLTSDGDNPPRVIGRVRLASGNIGGDADVDLEATLTLPLISAPDIEFGTSGDTDIVRGDGLAYQATAGTPGTWVGGDAPATLAILQKANIEASPGTAWTTGQSVELSDGSDVNWNGTAWEAGVA